MTCNSCNTCSFGTATTTQTTIESVSWAQITPLLMNADSVILEKFKVDSKGVITQDDKRWALTNIEWNFAPLAEAKSTFTIKPLPPKSEVVVQNDNAPDTLTDTAGQDDDDEVVEVFDFLSGVFKIYYDSKTQQILGEVETSEAGLMVTYRYVFHFYGKQKIEYSDLLEYRNTDEKATSALSGKDNIINRVIAL